MTSTQDKLRGLFLATLMVLSVTGGTVAFSGTVAATSNAHFDNFGAAENEVSPLNSTVFANSQQSVDEFQISFAGDANFDGSFSSVTDGNVEVKFFHGANRSKYEHFSTDATVSSQSDDTITIELQNAADIRNNDDIVAIFFSDNFENPSDSSITYTGNIDVEPAVGGNQFDGTLDVDQPTDGVGERELKQGNKTLDPNVQTTYYIGQKLLNDGTQCAVSACNDGWEQNEVVTLKDKDGDITTRTANQSATNTHVLFNTREIDNNEGLSPGVHHLEGDELVDPENISFKLRRQDLTAEFDENNVEKGGSTTLSIRSNNRLGYNVSIESEDLSATQIQNIFNEDPAQDRVGHSEGIEIVVSGSERNISADFSDIDTGDFDFEIRVVDAVASDNDTVSVIPEAGIQAELDQTSYQVPQGDLERFTVSLSNTERARLRIGSNEAGYNSTVWLRDGNGDDKVTVIMNTYLAGRRPTFPADESVSFAAKDSDDTVSANLTTNELNDILEQGDYELSTFVGATEKDVGTLIIEDRGTESLNISTAPAGESLTELEDVTDALDEGLITRDSTIAEEDLIVHTVRATGVFGAIANASGERTEVSGTGLTNIVNEGTVTLGIEQTNPDQNTVAKELDLDASQDAVDLVADEDNGTMYLIVDSEDAVFRRSTSPSDVFRAKDGDNFESEFNVSKDSILIDTDEADENESVTDSFEMVERNADFDLDQDGNVTVWSPDNEVISGTTTIAAGSELRIRARSSGRNAFLKTNVTDVESDGTFRAEPDFSDVTPPADFTATVRSGGTVLDEEDGQVVERPTATVTMNDQTVDAGQAGRQTLVVASVSMNKGGFVTIHDQTLQDGQTFASVRGSSAYLTPGQHSDVQVNLDDNIVESQTVFAMPHRDTDDDTAYTFVQTNGAEDGPYTEPGAGAVTDSASITVETPTATPSPSPTQPPATTTKPPTPSPTPTETPTPTQGPTPGFGITVAVISLAAAALLARRRLN